MELDQPGLIRQSHLTIMTKHVNPRNGKGSASPPSPSSRNDLRKHSASFRRLGAGVPAPDGSGAEKKLVWLRSQIIGGDAEFDSPFGRRRLTNADSTASGRCVRYVEDFIVDNILPFYGNSHTSDSHVGRQTTKTVHEASSYIKRCLGGGPEDAILFCGSGSTGSIKRLQEVMGVAVPSILRDRMIKCMPSEERWVVLVGPYEHHSNLLSWRQSLAEVIEIGLDEDGSIDMEDLKQKLESYRDANRPILGSFSACSNVTGICTDTRAVAKLLHQFGAFACFDFAASAPYVEIDMRSGKVDGYDAIFLSVHKFLGGPGSPGILLMSKALYRLGSSPPSTCGGGTVDYVNGFDEKDTLYVEDIEERENAGTPQIIQITRAALAFWLKDYVGYEVIEKLEHRYIKEAIERLSKNQNIKILGNKAAKREAILSFLIYSTNNSPPNCHKKGRERGLYLWAETGNERDKPLHGPFVATLLNDLFGIQARGGCACAGPYGHALLGISEAQSHAFRRAIQKGFAGVKPGWTRVSFPYYLSEEEFKYIIAALEFVACYGQRFLPLYHFNLKTGNWTFKKKAFMETVGKERKGKIFVLNDNQAGEDPNGDAKQESLTARYTSYWESAKHIASLLPKFPSPRRLQDHEFDDSSNICYFLMGILR